MMDWFKRFRITYVGLGIMIFAGIIMALGIAEGANGPSLSLGMTQVMEGDDFSTMVLGLPWNMDQPPYPDFETVFQNVDRGSFASSGSKWSFQTTTNDPYLFLLSTGIEDTQEVLRMGDRYPIDASKYSLVSFRMCSDVSDLANIYWFMDKAPHTQYAASEYVSYSAGCGTYTIDLNATSLFDQHGGVDDWEGSVRGFRLDPVYNNSSANLELEWLRLTSVDLTNVIPINWSGVSTGTDLNFYLNSSCSNTDGTLIGTVPQTASGTFNWGSALLNGGDPLHPYPLPESFEPGEYTIVMLVDGAGTPYCPASTLEIVGAPILTFQKPSPFSGSDYATVIVNDQWGMSNSADIPLVRNISSSHFTDGIYSMVNSTGDPNLHFNVDTSVDTNVYHHVTFRMMLEGNQSIGGGWVSRFVWWSIDPGVDPVVTQDMIIYEGWQTYSLDLDAALIEPSFPGSWSGNPIVFRLDPHEVATPKNLYLDYVLLTGDETVSVGDAFPLYYDLSESIPATVTFYYDNDQNPSNGRTLMQAYSAPAPPNPELMFMPIIDRVYTPPEILPPSGTSWVWDTTGVPLGSYYVCAEVTDGLNTTIWYSEIPVAVTS